MARLAPSLAGALVVLLAAPTVIHRLAPPARSPAADPAAPIIGRTGWHRRRWRRWAPSAPIAALLLLDPVLALVAGSAALGVPAGRRVTARRRRQAEIDRAVPDAIELLVLVIRAGLTPHQAVDALATHAPRAVRPGFEAVRHRIDRGADLADALAALPDALGPAMAPTADTLAIAVRHGSAIGDALRELSLEVRHRRRRRAEADARRLPIRLSFPLVCCTLPSFVLVAIAPAVLAALSSLGDTAW